MISVHLTLSNPPVCIGYKGENVHTEIRFDAAEVFAEYPDATTKMLVRNPEGVLYPVELTRDEGDLVWLVTRSDLAAAGSGRYQISFLDGEEVFKTCIGTIIIQNSLDGEEGDIPDPIETWIEKADAILDEAQEDIERAEALIDTTLESATKAEGYAVGQKDGEDVDPESPYHQNNAKYYSEQAGIAKDASVQAKEAAVSAAEEANQSKTAAEKSASDAAGAKDAAADAQGKAEAAQGKAETAQEKAETAQSKAETAQEKAETAQSKAEAAQRSAGQAAGAAEGAAGNAAQSASAAGSSELKAEGYAVGKQDGTDVESGSPYYQNNAKYYKEQAALSEGQAKEYRDSSQRIAQGIETAGAEQVQAVNRAGTTQTQAVNQAGTTKVQEVNQAGTAQVQAVNQAGANQVSAVNTKGQEVLDSIPDDYSALTEEVSDLKSALNDLEDESVVLTELLDTTEYTKSTSNAVTNNNDGTYTIGTNDYGSTFWKTKKKVPAGTYRFVGAPGDFFTVVSKSETYTGTDVIAQNSTDETVAFENPVLQYLYFGIRVSARPSESFIYTPSIIEDVSKFDIHDAELKKLNKLYYDKDSNTYYRAKEDYSRQLKFANGAIIDGNFDTQPVIEYHDYGLYNAPPEPKVGLCVTKIYPVQTGEIVRYYLANPSSISASGLNRYQTMNGTEIVSGTTVTVGTEKSTGALAGDGIRFTLYNDGVNDSYAYLLRTGEILFAGENTLYFGKRNINGDNTPPETLISDKNAEEKLMNKSGLVIGKDGKLHLAYEGGAIPGSGISFADGVVVDGFYDTKIHIAEYGKCASNDAAIVVRYGSCYTLPYDLVSENATITYYFANPDSLSFSNSNKIQWWRDDTYVGYSHENLDVERDAACTNTENKANKLVCSLTIAGIDDSWCIDKSTGTVIFAGKNTEYFGKKTIYDVPPPTPRDYGAIGANYPDEIEIIEKHLANGATYQSETGITNRFAFCHISDFHAVNSSSLAYADEFTDLSDASFLAMTGDNVSDQATDSFDHVKELINAMTKPCYITFGNHDVAGSTALSTRFDHQFAQIKDHNNQSSLQTTYYAIDYAIDPQGEIEDKAGVTDVTSGIKCIFLDCYDGYEDYTGFYMTMICEGHMSSTQINWLAGQLQDAITNAYDVAIFMHHAPDTTGQVIHKFFDSSEYARNLTFIADMVNAYQNGGSVTFEHMNNSYSFSFSGKGGFVGYFVGHTHCDGAYFLERYPKQLCVTIGTPWGNGSKMSGTNMNHGLRVKFNYVTIDKKKKVVTVFRVGNQDTYYGYKRDLFSVRYY